MNLNTNRPIRPLEGVHIIEFEGIGPAPMAGHLLAEMGATVTALVRPGTDTDKAGSLISLGMRKGKTIRALDLKQPGSIEVALELVGQADALIEGNRPGVMERLGLGPAVCAARNPRLVYSRVTGWGQDGPLAQAAGHDLNYVALSGLLSLSARPGTLPLVPPTVLGDASGALGLAFGVASALLGARATGRGCVVDAAMVNVAAMMSALALGARNAGLLDGTRPSVFHDSPYYDIYRCSDGQLISICAMEPQFYAQLLTLLGLHDVTPTRQHMTGDWPALKARLTALFASEPRPYWCKLLEGTDVCFAPVLTLDDALTHPHNVARGLYRLNDAGHLEASVAPRFLPLTS